MTSFTKHFDKRSMRIVDYDVCPYCGSVHIKKNGKSKGGHQRWICRDCSKTFSGRVNTIAFSSKLRPHQIKSILYGLIDNMTYSQISHLANVSNSTINLWRRKLEFQWRNKSKVVLKDKVWIDEMYVDLTGRNQKRGKGISDDSLRIFVALDENGTHFAKVEGTGLPSANDFRSVYSDIIEKGAIIIHDISSTGDAFKDNIEMTYKSKTKKGFKMLNIINSFCAQIRRMFFYHCGIRKRNIQKHLDFLCYNIMQSERGYKGKTRLMDETIFYSGINLIRKGLIQKSATL